MTISGIIEYEGRRFVRTGEFRSPKRDDWFWSDVFSKPMQATVDDRPFVFRSILRELPAETPALATAQTPCCPKCKAPLSSVKYDEQEEVVFVLCYGSCETRYELHEPEQFAQFFTASGLLAEAEEALQAFADWGKECDNPRPSEAEIERQFQLFAKCRAVLARIRAAKEKP